MAKAEPGRDVRDDIPFRPALAVTVLAAILFATFAAIATRNAPRGGGTIDDNAISLYEAAVLADGRLFGSAPPVEPRSFRVEMIVAGREGRSWGKDYPGYPLLLALGLRSGVEWVVNPVLAALVMVVTFLLGRTVRGNAVGLAAALLLASSPTLLEVSSLYLNHVTCMLFVVAAAAALARAERGGSSGWGIAAGFALGWSVAARPYSAALLGIPFAAFLGTRVVLRKPGGLRVALAVAGGTLPWVLGMMFWNAALTGDPFLTPYQYFRPGNHPGLFGPGPRGPSFADTLRATGFIVRIFTERAFAIPGLLAAVVVLPLLAWRRRGGFEILLGIAGIVLIGGHVFYGGITNFSARIGGGRFYCEALPAYALLVASSAAWLVRRRGAVVKGAVLALPILLLAYAAMRPFPAILARIGRNDGLAVGAGSHRLDEFLDGLGDGRRLVFVDVSTYHWNSAFLVNRPDFTGANVVAIYWEPEANRRVMDAFPDREAYRFRVALPAGAIEFTRYDPDADRTGPPLSRFPYAIWKRKEEARRQRLLPGNP